MKPRMHLGILTSAFGLLIMAAGCSHFPTGNGFKGGGGTAPVILTFHDTPPANIAVTSFEVTVTGAVLQPGNISLLSAPGQTVELTQLQANSTFLSTNNVATGTYNSLTITYANSKYTVLNDTNASFTAFGTTCAVGQSCVITPTVTRTTATISSAPFPIIVGSTSQELIEVDVNLNNIIQSNFAVDFGASGAVTVNQQIAATPAAIIDSLALSGAITAVVSSPSQSFTLTASTGQSFKIPVTSNTQFSQFNQSSRKSSCVANNFSCLNVGQVVDVQLQILGTGAFQAAEVDFDDAGSTQQVSGTIVSLTGTPPTSFQMIVHNSVPALASVATGTPATVTISSGASFLINNGLFVLPAGSFNFGISADLHVGQEVEARVSGTVTLGPPVTFTTDRLALEPSQLTAVMFNPNSGTLSFSMNTLPPLFSSGPTPIIQMQVLTSSQNQTQFQTLPTGTFTDLTNAAPPNNIFSVGGFLFNSANPQIPNLAAVVVRAQVPGT